MSGFHGDHLTRRAFLRTTGLTAAAAGMSALAPAYGGPQTQPARPLLPHGTLGRTKHPVTLISFGAIKLRDRNHMRVLKLAIDKGVNLVHTSDSYGGGKSIETVGELFRADRQYREKVFLCLKGLTHQKEPDIDRMLKTLDTDHADVILCELQRPETRRLETIQTLQDTLKKKGKVRHTGFVCHVDMNGSMEMVVAKAPDYFDVALLALRQAPVPGDDGKKRTGQESQRLVKNLKALRAKGVGILSMKSGAAEAVQKGAHVFLPHAKAVLEAGADSVLTSMDAFEQVDLVAGLDIRSPHLSEKERQAAVEFRDSQADVCLMCGNCTGACPRQIPVNDLMRWRMYATRYGIADQARIEYAQLGADVQRAATNCGLCTLCSGVCPIGLASAERVGQVAAMLG